MQGSTTLLTALIVAACAAFSIAPAASAAAAPHGTTAAARAGLYGGGAVRDYLQFVSVRVLPGGSFSAHATLVTKCSPRFGDALTETVSVRNERLSPRGRYSETSTFTDQIAPGVPTVGGLRAEGTIAFSVGVAAPGRGRADGVVRVRTVYRDPDSGAEVARCDTGRIRWQARRPRDTAGSGPAGSHSGVLRGTTGQGEPFLMRLAPGARSVRRAGLTVRMSCPSGVGLGLDVVAHRVRIRRGRFGAGDEFRRPFTYPDGTEVVEHYSWALRGRLGESGARGAFAMRGTVRRRSDGERIGFCKTGRVPWRAVP